MCTRVGFSAEKVFWRWVVMTRVFRRQNLNFCSGWLATGMRLLHADLSMMRKHSSSRTRRNGSILDRETGNFAEVPCSCGKLESEEKISLFTVDPSAESACSRAPGGGMPETAKPNEMIATIVKLEYQEYQEYLVGNLVGK